MSRPIDAVLFDFGGVITAASPFTLLGQLGAAAGVSPEETLALLLGPYHEDTDHAWHRAERGEIGIMDWFREASAACAAAGIELELSALAALASLGLHEAVVDKVRQLKDDGYRTGIITNNIKEGAGWREMLDVEGLFDVVVDSAWVGMRKPNPAIYRHALELLGDPAPERVVFLDDAPGNVEGARAVGMRAVLVEADPTGALEQLDRILAGTE